MITLRLAKLNALRALFSESLVHQRTGQLFVRNSTHYRSGALKPRPEAMPIRIVGIVLCVTSGLLVGATISKNFAAFLEENELFVVSEDDDDDDD